MSNAFEAARAISVADVLERHGIEPLRHGRGPCPVCGTSDRSQSFSANGRLWKCFACGAGGDSLALEAALGGGSVADAARRLTGKDVGAPVSGVAKLNREWERRRKNDKYAAWLAVSLLAADHGRLYERLADEAMREALTAQRVEDVKVWHSRYLFCRNQCYFADEMMFWAGNYSLDLRKNQGARK